MGDDGLLVGNNLILSTLDLYDFFNDLPYLIIESLYLIVESLYLTIEPLYLIIESLYSAVESPYIATEPPYNLLDCLYILTDLSILQVDTSKHGNNHGERCKNILYVHDSFLPDDRYHVTSMSITRPSFQSILASRATGRTP